MPQIQPWGIKMPTRLCNHCKKPMFNSWAGERINGKFIEIHQKCKEEYFICKGMGDMADFFEKNDANAKGGEQ